MSTITCVHRLTAGIFDWTALSDTSKVLMVYGAIMWLACATAYCASWTDVRTLRDVGVWVKPMKFMAATAALAWTTVWVSHLVNHAVTQIPAYRWIALLLITTSLFEVVYITYQGARADASHYNTTDPLHTALFGLMAVAAVALTASQAWLAWEIWKHREVGNTSLMTWGVVTGLAFTFVLASISGFMLGAKQPPPGQGLPLLGWHLYADIRPAHFLGVHAQQLIPLWALLADKYLASYAQQGLALGSAAYLLAWATLTWTAL